MFTIVQIGSPGIKREFVATTRDAIMLVLQISVIDGMLKSYRARRMK